MLAFQVAQLTVGMGELVTQIEALREALDTLRAPYFTKGFQNE